MFIRPPAVSSQFYPENPNELKNLINDFLKNQSKKLFIPDKIKAFIVPHAGYIYSGFVAASAYQILSLSLWQPKKIILIGPSHHFPIIDFVFSSADQWETPLGKIPTYFPFKNKDDFVFDDLAFQLEHCLEVQLPFLQVILSNFQILPILINNENQSKKLAEILNSILDKETLLIISSDLSHYYPLNIAEKIDAQTINLILQLKTDEIENIDACGAPGILTLMYLAKELKWKVKLIDYQTSFNSSGDKNSVVGYSSFVFYE